MPLSPGALAAHRHRIYGYAFRLLRDRDDAADVTQDVLVRVWRHGDTVEPDRRNGWVLRVTRNACLDAIRARQTRDQYVPTNLDQVPDAESHHQLPDALAEAADFRLRLDAALDQLEEPYRSIVILREIEEHSYRDIAEALDLPLNTLKVYLHRGRQRLRVALRSIVPAEDLLS